MKAKPDVNLLKEEYFHLQALMEAFDAKALTIKAWSVTLGVAGLGASSFEKHTPGLLLTAFAGLLFWIIEAHWKSFQYSYRERIDLIEAFFRGDEEDPVHFQISHAWMASWQAEGRSRVRRLFCLPHVFLPHAALFFGGVGLFCWYDLIT